MAYLQERNQIVKQVRSQGYIDGFIELEVGIDFLVCVISLVIYIAMYDLFYPLASNGFLAFIQIMLLIIFINIPSFLTRIVKTEISQQRKRITSLRTGFISFEEPTNNKLNTWGSVAITVAVIATVVSFISISYFVYMNPSFSTLVSGSALLLIIAVAVITNLVIWYRIDYQHFYFYAVASLLLGCVIFVFFMQTKNLFKSLILYGFALGFTFLLLGVATLRRYLRDYPPVGQDDE